jgi:ferric-dicitrate binding protein FerR (iron transport regulator)
MDRELLERYLSGDASPDECARVEAWLAQDPDRWARLSEVRGVAADAALSESAVQKAKAEVWARLARKIGWAGESHAGRVARRQGLGRQFVAVSRRPWLSGWQLAAGLLVAVIGGSALGVLLFRWRPSAPAEAIRVVATKPGQRAAFRLSDSTQVVLGVASTLRYPATFPGGSREVSLEGEAYFEVAPDMRRPFMVRAGDLVAKDLGTEFTVRAYPEDAGARVVVREGRVAIRAAATGAAPERVVAPGQLGRLGAGQEPTVERADTAAWFAWTEGRLVFDGTPLRDALPQLGRWFDLEFHLADSALGEVPLTATLRTQPTTDVLNNLAASLGMKQRQAGRVVTLYSAEPNR